MYYAYMMYINVSNESHEFKNRNYLIVALNKNDNYAV